MPEAPTPPSVQIARLIVGAVVALALVGAATLGLVRHDLTAEAYVALVTLAATGAGIGVAASSRRKRRTSAEGTTYTPAAIEPETPTARHRRSGETTQTMRALDQGDRAMRGFARRGPLVAVAFAVGALVLAPLAGALLAGCPLPPVDGCRPGATRCSSAGIPQRCSGTGRWWQEPTAQTCSTFGATCCLAASPYGGTVHACVPAVACVASPAGPTSSPSALAETQ